MRLASLAAAGLFFACGGRPEGAPRSAPATSMTAAPAAPPAAKDRLLPIAGPHQITAAHWAAHRVVGRSERELWFADPARPDQTHVVFLPAPIHSLATETASSVVAVLLEDGHLRTYEHGVLLHESQLEAKSSLDALAPDGRYLLTSLPTSSDVRVLDTRTGAVVSTFDQDGSNSSFDPTGTYLLRAGSLVRVKDGGIMKAWRAPDADGAYTQAWVNGRGVVFEQKYLSLIDPTSLVVKRVPYECKPGVYSFDFTDPPHGTILHLCGDRAMFVDATSGRVTRVKLPLGKLFGLLDIRARSNGSLVVRGERFDGVDSTTSVEIAIDAEHREATVVDRATPAATDAKPTFEERSCARWVGAALGHGDFCEAEADGAYWLTTYGGSFAIADAEREILRIGARSPGVRLPNVRLIGGAGLGLVLEVPDPGDGTSPGLRWKLGEPEDTPQRAVNLDDRRCDAGVALPNGHLLAICAGSSGGRKVKPKRADVMVTLVEISEQQELLAERRLENGRTVVVVNDHPVTWDGWAPPLLATEWAGPPSTCAASCAPVATYALHRDFAIRIDTAGKMQVAGTLDPNALACIDAEGLARPFAACRAQGH